LNYTHRVPGKYDQRPVLCQQSAPSSLKSGMKTRYYFISRRRHR